MANETAVDESQTEIGSEEPAVDERATQGQEGSEGEASSNAIDPAAYERLQQEHSQLTQNWEKLSRLANTDPVFKKELERAWKGLPPAQQAQIRKEAQNKAEGKPQSNKEIEELKQTLKQLQEGFQSQQQEAIRREKFSEVQNETEAMWNRFNATDADKKEFWDRYGRMIQNEAFSIMQQRPGTPPNVATQVAYSNHSRNLAAEYVMLMEDRMVDFYGKKIQERTNPLKGIATPAEKAGKAGMGVTPTLKERFLNGLKKERDPEKRAEMMKAFSEQTGMPIDNLFRSSGG